MNVSSSNVSSSNVSSSEESYVSLGDMGDKNNGDLQIYRNIKHRIQDLSQKWTLIAGNRDDNKIRFLSEFTNKEYIDNFLERNNAPYWAEATEKPIDYCSKNRLLGDTVNSGDILGTYRALSHAEKRAIVAKWTLDKTMGAPKKFQFRKEELATLLKKESEITDDMVVCSFIEEMVSSENERNILVRDGNLPESPVLPPEYIGVTRYYIDNSKSFEISDGNLYSHSGIPSDYNEGDILQFTLRANEKRKNLIASFIEDIFKKRTGEIGISKHPAVQLSLPKDATDERKTNVTSLNSLEDPVTKQALKKLGSSIKSLIHGHQPVMTPTILFKRAQKLFIANLDTSLVASNPNLQNPTQTKQYVYEDDSSRFVSYSEYNGNKYLLDSNNENLGLTVSIKGTVYTIVAEELDTDSYYLVNYEKPAGKPFFIATPISYKKDVVDAAIKAALPSSSFMINALAQPNIYLFMAMTLCVAATVASVMTMGVLPLAMAAATNTAVAITAAASVVTISSVALAGRFFATPALPENRRENSSEAPLKSKLNDVAPAPAAPAL